VLEKDALGDGVSRLWYADEFRRMSPNTTLLVGPNRVNLETRRVGSVGSMILEGAVPEREATVAGCIDPGTLRRVAGAVVPVLHLK
jgi:hypothetical protein